VLLIDEHKGIERRVLGLDVLETHSREFFG
jgi:hypothetical protein